MIRQKNDLGMIRVDADVYTDIAGYAASNCFGVKGMVVRSVSDGLWHLLRREAMSKGVHVSFHDDGSISIELHIMVDRGINLSAICDSIISEVRYIVTKSTGTQVRAVHVFVDSITTA